MTTSSTGSSFDEFGHALGLIHEHARPDSQLVWDEGALREYYVTLTSGNWDWDMIRYWVMKLYDKKLVDLDEA